MMIVMVKTDDCPDISVTMPYYTEWMNEISSRRITFKCVIFFVSTKSVLKYRFIS